MEAVEWALGSANHDCLNISFCFMKLKPLFNDTAYWIENETYPFDEISARFHHRLVSIHAFPNGNGRHARMRTEVIQTANGEKPFTWGSSDLYTSESEARNDYLASLRHADKGNYQPLIEFVRKQNSAPLVKLIA